MTIIYKVNRFRSLCATERQIFMKAIVLLPIVSIFVKWIGINHTIAWLRREPSINPISLESQREIAQAYLTASLVQKAIDYSLIKGKCLSQSIVLWHLLHSQGIDSVVCIGVQKTEANLPIAIENFNAHAWVEIEGEVLNDIPNVRQRYRTFERVFSQPGK